VIPWLRHRALERIHVVADYGPGDEPYVGLSLRLALFAPEADVVLTQVPACDSLAGGIQVARLALGHGSPATLVLHDIGARPVSGAGPRECAGWTEDGVTIVGPDTGWSWSFVAAEISGPCYLEIPGRCHSPELLAAATVRALARHPHAVRERVPPDCIPPIPAVRCGNSHIRSR
jgi:hypothetical protein